MSQPEVTILVISWNVRDTLRQCLASARQSKGIKGRIIVIDNASTDGSAAMVLKEFPEATLIRNSKNQGFAAAVNQGLHQATGDVLLLNPDVMLQPQTIEGLEDVLSQNPRVGIAGPHLRYPNGESQPSVKRFPRGRDLWWQLSKVPNIIPAVADFYHASGFDYSRTQVVDQVMGSCFLIRRQTLNDVGLFDEGFWIWFEEVDFCRRAKDYGWDTIYVANTEATHVRAKSFQQVSTRQKQKYLRNSIRHYTRKYFGHLAMVGQIPVMILSQVSALFIDLLGWRKPVGAKNF